jgi:acyl-CoA thioesterase-1
MNLKNTLHKLETGEPVKIVALGDSLTYGWMVDKGFLDYLKEMLAVKYPGSLITIINRGIPGDTAEGGLHRLEHHVLKSEPDLVFIQFALNDAFSGYPVERFQRNIESIIGKIINETSSELLLMTSVALEENEQWIAEKFYSTLQQIAEKEEMQIVCVHEYWERKMGEGTAFDTLVQADRVHPTTAGYRLMAEAVMEVL